ncbi:hypothetical protein MmazTMA_14810 [Methanosarcina mazei]|nr:hypothetical protein MmazTMA_14810 [Methanosarcina mazei]
MVSHCCDCEGGKNYIKRKRVGKVFRNCRNKQHQGKGKRKADCIPAAGKKLSGKSQQQENSERKNEKKVYSCKRGY